MPLLTSPLPLLRLRHPSPLRVIAAAVDPGDAPVDLPVAVRRRLFQNKNLVRAKKAIKSPLLNAPFSSGGLLSLGGVILPDQAVGFVAAAQANFMRVIVESPGGSEPSVSDPDPRVGAALLCSVRSLLKKIKRYVLVGDRVVVGSVDWLEGRGVVEDVFERRSEFADPPVANVDHVVILFSLDKPEPEPVTLTRFLVEAESTGIPFSLVFNKTELVSEETISNWKERLNSWGYQPLFCSVEQKSGLSTVEETLKGQTVVIIGPSGVGKSSLINALRGYSHTSEAEDTINELLEKNKKWIGEQAVGDVSKRSGKGKHTTRHISLLPLKGGGYLADTPGFNQPTLLKTTKRSIAQAFPEIRKMLQASEPKKCTFSDCLHLGDRGCVVNNDWERYPYYLQLVEEIKVRESLQLRTLGTKKEGDVRYKSASKGTKQAEPKLDIKKHRRVSRKKLNQSILDDVDGDDLDYTYVVKSHRK